MKKCYYCGAPNPDNRTACFSCGESLDSPPQANPNTTPYPNAQAAANTVFDPDARTVIMAPSPPPLMTLTPPPTQSFWVFNPNVGSRSNNNISTIFISILVLLVGIFLYHMVVVVPLQHELKQQNRRLHDLTDVVNNNAEAANENTGLP